MDLLVKAMAVVVCLQAIGLYVFQDSKMEPQMEENLDFLLFFGSVVTPSALTSSLVCSDGSECLPSHFLVSNVPLPSVYILTQKSGLFEDSSHSDGFK